MTDNVSPLWPRRKLLLTIVVTILTLFSGLYLLLKPLYKLLIPDPAVAPYYKQEDLTPPSKLESTMTEKKYKVPILMYHYIEYVQNLNDFIRKSLDITPDIFEKQLKTIQGSYQTIFVNDLSKTLIGEGKLPEKPLILTFDDGYRDFYTDALPLLKKYNLKATIYVVPGFLDTPNYLTKDELREISRSGLVEVASHTVHHVYLKLASEKTSRREIFDSKKMIEEIINRPVTDFAYPYGAFSETTEKLVKEAGYGTSASVIPGVYQSESNRFFLYRLRAGSLTGQGLLNFINNHK